jgi:hypothetical protein
MGTRSGRYLYNRSTGTIHLFNLHHGLWRVHTGSRKWYRLISKSAWMKQHSSRGCCTGYAYVDCHSIWITLTVKHSTCHYCKSETPHKISGAIWGQKRWCWSPFDTQPHFYVVVGLVANAKSTLVLNAILDYIPKVVCEIAHTFQKAK